MRRPCRGIPLTSSALIPKLLAGSPRAWLQTNPFPPALQLLAGEGDWQGAVRLCATLAEAGVQPDSATAAALVAAAQCGAGSDGLAETLAARFRTAGLLPQDSTPSNGGGGGGKQADSRAPSELPAQQTNGQLDQSEQ